MKRSWRWPLAGFLLGGLVGATFLTVNVVGASSPNAPPVRAGSFGEILHTPPLLVRAGKPVELSFGVVCRVVADEPRRACNPHGSVFVRGGGEATFRKLPLAEEPDGLLSAVVPGTDTRDGFDYYAAIDDGRGVSAALPEAAGAAPQHVWPLAQFDLQFLLASSHFWHLPASHLVMH